MNIKELNLALAKCIPSDSRIASYDIKECLYTKMKFFSLFFKNADGLIIPYETRYRHNCFYSNIAVKEIQIKRLYVAYPIVN